METTITIKLNKMERADLKDLITNANDNYREEPESYEFELKQVKEIKRAVRKATGEYTTYNLDLILGLLDDEIQGGWDLLSDDQSEADLLIMADYIRLKDKISDQVPAELDNR